ncbi:FkbM family methyltransferase [Campylobacter jejuni]|uniref:FkbM family methyltransferase n=1 Tax=Campylobacter jejuni TaxID=197 RepID=UPI000FA1D65F|nr:FkbM family methyltransferase [Campylobacter jejuni]MFI80662.1 FkbM family methyltransferase [Campylobacter jejuni]
MKRKGSNFNGFIFSKYREVKILNGGRKVVIYTIRFFYLIIYRKTIDFSKYEILDGGGALQFSLAEAMLNNDYLNDKLKILIKGLDKDSIETVLKIVKRLKKSYKSMFFINKELYEEEKIELRNIKNNFQNRIYKVDSNRWFYNGYYLPISAFEISVFYHKHSLSALTTLNKIKKLDIIDVGAYIGDSALILSEYTEGKIHCFEIDKKNFNLLKSTVVLNNKQDKIMVYNFALGKDKQNLGIEYDNLGIGSRVVDLNKSSEEQRKNFDIVEQTTLDNFCKSNPNVKIGFIKVDIEGAEMDFLKGAKETICSQKPAMLISIYHNSRDFFEIKPLLDSWDVGYVFKIVKPVDHTIAVETALFCEVL